MLRQATPLSTKDTIARIGAWALLDRRLTDSLRVLATDQTQTTERRRFFLSLLVRYAAPNAVIDEGSLDSGAPAVLSTMLDPGGVHGTWPPNTQSHGVVLYTIQQMASNDPDARLRKLAAQVYTELPNYVQ